MQRSVILLVGVCVFLFIFAGNSVEARSLRNSGDTDLINILGRLASPSKSRKSADTYRSSSSDDTMDDLDDSELAQLVGNLITLAAATPQPNARVLPLIPILGQLTAGLVSGIIAKEITM